MFNPQEYLRNPVFDVPNPHETLEQTLKIADKKQVEVERLCYEIFHLNENGVKLWESYQENFINKSFFELRERYPKYRVFFDTHPELMSFYWEAYKDALRSQYLNGLQHKKRILEGNN